MVGQYSQQPGTYCDTWTQGAHDPIYLLPTDQNTLYNHMNVQKFIWQWKPTKPINNAFWTNLPYQLPASKMAKHYKLVRTDKSGLIQWCKGSHGWSSECSQCQQMIRPVNHNGHWQWNTSAAVTEAQSLPHCPLIG